MPQTRSPFPRLALLFVAIATPLVAACASGDDDDPTEDPGRDPAPASEVRSEIDRAEVDETAAAGAADSVTAFAADLYAELSAGDGNLAFSPYSVALALAMTRAGAEGDTASEMDDVLHTALAGDIHAGFNALDLALAERSGEYDIGSEDGPAELVLSMANQLWGQHDTVFVETFLDRLAADYGAGMRLVDYKNHPEAAREAINAWVAERTRDRIPELVPEDTINELTRLVLVNAIYLNAPWMHRFDQDKTAPAPFTRLDGDEVEAEMMHLGARIRYGEGDGFEAVELPYVDGSLSMVVALPTEGEFGAFESGLDAGQIDEIVEGLGDAQVNLDMPKFEFRTQAGLKDALAALGMPLAFDPDRADFTGMVPAEENEGIHIQDAVHEAFISVDEHGTEAAAATAVMMGAVSAPPVNVDLTLDRPFFFFIRDQETGALLFMGRVTDPTAE